MDNKSRIQANNAELREAIEMAEKLPDAGGGGTPTPTQEKTIDVTENGTVEVTPDEGYALSKVTANVNVPIPDGYIKPNGTLQITENGEHTVTEYETVNVNVPTGEEVTEETNEYTAKLEALETAITELEAELQGKAAGNGITLEDIATKAIEGDVVLGVDTIGSYTFHGCSKITSLSAPNVTSVGTYAFYATGLTGALDLPLCTSIGAYAFYQCTNITSLSIPNVTSVGTNAFQYCNKLTALDAPNLTTLGSYAFSGNNTYKMAFKSINLPKCTAIPNSTLGYCVNLTELVLPECKSIGNSSLTNCTNLEFVDLPKCTSIVNYGLRNNSELGTLILRSETMCTLSNYALNSTKIFNGTGYVYVPRALIASYQTATNWKTVYGKNANAFRALEDYTVDGTLTGALDESKI